MTRLIGTVMAVALLVSVVPVLAGDSFQALSRLPAGLSPLDDAQLATVEGGVGFDFCVDCTNMADVKDHRDLMAKDDKDHRDLMKALMKDHMKDHRDLMKALMKDHMKDHRDLMAKDDKDHRDLMKDLMKDHMKDLMAKDHGREIK